MKVLSKYTNSHNLFCASTARNDVAVYQKEGGKRKLVGRFVLKLIKERFSLEDSIYSPHKAYKLKGKTYLTSKRPPFPWEWVTDGYFVFQYKVRPQEQKVELVVMTDDTNLTNVRKLTKRDLEIVWDRINKK